MDEFRFLELSTHDAFHNMAIDESIMLSIKEDESPPTLRFYRWNPSAVSIGTFQGMTEEVDIEFCRKRKIDAIRRITGGGAVYHDYEGEITYSIIMPKSHRLAPVDIFESYGLICAGIIRGLDILGIPSEFKPINDIVSGNKKISGNAQTRKHGCLLQHGTVLLDLDVELMFSILKVPKEKISDKMIADVKERVTSIRDILGSNISIESLREALAQGFSEGLCIDLVSDALTTKEKDRVEELVRHKYATKDWNFSR
ncbi:MAG: lipoate--protein ligase family protein [Candidatus Thorarchaeota archaeon]|nr:lipoate--protein ligase family protein [Candidatus Thorarchaeota archaeon]